MKQKILMTMLFEEVYGELEEIANEQGYQLQPYVRIMIEKHIAEYEKPIDSDKQEDE